MITVLHRVRAFLFPPAAERTVIDQGAYYDGARARLARMKAIDLTIDKERHRVATLVGGWANTTVSNRDRARLPHIVGPIGRRIHAWLPGLSTSEIMKLKAAPSLDIVHHIFEDHAIIGVRPVQPLELALLFWPRPLLNGDQRDGAGGSGPRGR